MLDRGSSSQEVVLSDYETGKRRVEWAFGHMAMMQRIRKRFAKEKPFRGMTAAICLHLEPKAANVALTMKAGGADVVMCPSNRLSTQDSTVSYLKRHMTCYGKRGEDPASFRRNLHRALDHRPALVMDDGAQLLELMHETGHDALDRVKGLSEETTTGIRRIRTIEGKGSLRFPCIGVNDASMKQMFDNRHGTGQSTIEGLLAATNLTLCGKVATVVGYGWVGKGVALRLRGLGTDVIVTEVDPVKALDARMEGFRVMPMLTAAPLSDFVITTTGGLHVVGARHLGALKNGCVLANVGHTSDEIDLAALRRSAKRRRLVRANVEEFDMGRGRRLYLLAEGELVNIAIGQGHPIEIMDMTFALQLLAQEYLARGRRQLENRYYDVPSEINTCVARLGLETLGITIDSPTKAPSAVEKKR